jgi:IMP dehydrogenase
VKAIACGADAAMLGRPLAAAEEAPGPGRLLGAVGRAPRAATRSLRPGRDARAARGVLEGPAHRDDGRVNLVGGLRRAMGVTGYETLARLREAELVVTRAHG